MPALPAARRGGRVNVPQITGNVASRGNAFTRWSMRGLMWITGWRFSGADFPDCRKFVLILAPHTSNWDFPVGVMAMYSLGIRGTFLAKDSLFRGPLGVLMRFLGGHPVDRSARSDVVTQTVQLIDRTERIMIVLAPEGTRKRVARWRSGFWWIAQRARIPILPVAFDFGRKEIRLFPLYEPTDDQDRDIAAIRALYEPSMAYAPEKFAAPR